MQTVIQSMLSDCVTERRSAHTRSRRHLLQYKPQININRFLLTVQLTMICLRNYSKNAEVIDGLNTLVCSYYFKKVLQGWLAFNI